MADSGTVGVHINPYDYTDDIRVNGYHLMFPLLRDTLQNPVCISILLSHHHAHYTVAPVTVAPVTVFVLLSC